MFQMLNPYCRKTDKHSKLITKFLFTKKWRKTGKRRKVTENEKQKKKLNGKQQILMNFDLILIIKIK